MAKYSFEFKRMVVMEYVSGQGGYDFLAKKHGIPSSIRIREWVARYNRFGEDGLRRSRQNQVYPFEFKLHVVELYLSSEISYKDLALQVGVMDPGRIVQWVTAYRAAGPEALKPKKKGRKRTMDKEKVIREIEDGDFLKEARRLRLEEEALQRKQRESSTASEENSN